MTDAEIAVERARRRAELLHELQGIAERLRANELEHSELLAQRAAKVQELKNAGARTDELQDVLGVTRGRVHQILRGART